MTRSWRSLQSFPSSICASLLLATGVVAQGSTSFASSSNVAVYWGQNSYGQSSGSQAQQRLATYCANSDIDIIPMAFMTQVTGGTGNVPVLNFANQQNNCSVFAGTDLINCPQIGEDITTCQQQYGKKILLSIGGATYTEGGFSSHSEAVQAANQVWAMFGPQGTQSTVQQLLTNNLTQTGNLSVSTTIARRQQQRTKRATVVRPFGDAVLDGFDFDFESTVTNITPFARRLRQLMSQDTSKSYYLTAAPQCVYPDAADNAFLSSTVHFDAVFVQFYNNYCGSQSYSTAQGKNQSSFDFSIWNHWARTESANKNVKVFLGVPANTGAAGSGYLDAQQLQPVIEYSKSFSSFGGVMMWDASQAYANTGFLPAVKSAVGGTTTTTRRGMVARRWQA